MRFETPKSKRKRRCRGLDILARDRLLIARAWYFMVAFSLHKVSELHELEKLG